MIFVDTSFLFPLLSANDRDHPRVLSLVAMDAFGITEAWAVDSDFTHRFTVKPGPAT